MKRDRPTDHEDAREPFSRKKSRRNVSEVERDRRVTELLKMCLQKVVEIQEDLDKDTDEDSDAEGAGYAACAVETMRFLAAEGYGADHPMIKGLRQRLSRR